MEHQTGVPIVIENGQYWSKNGYAGDEIPRSVFPTLISFHKGPSIMGDIEKYIRDYNIGEDALKAQPADHYRLGHSIGPRGIVEDLTSLEKIWHYTFYTSLKQDPSEHPVILLLDAGLPVSEIAGMGEILFETFNVPQLAFVTAQFVATYTAKLLPTALVVDVGHVKTVCLPIVNQVPLTRYRAFSPVAGRTLDLRVLSALEERGFREKQVDIANEILQTIKRDYCYIKNGEKNVDPQVTERMAKEGKEITFPNDIHLNLGAIPSVAPRILLEGGILGEISLIDVIAATIAKCPEEARVALRKHILLCGGTSNIPGFRGALESRLNSITDFDAKGKYKVYHTERSEFTNWRGASIAGSSNLSPEFYLSHEQYKQDGPGTIQFADSYLTAHFKEK